MKLHSILFIIFGYYIVLPIKFFMEEIHLLKIKKKRIFNTKNKNRRWRNE